MRTPTAEPRKGSLKENCQTKDDLHLRIRTISGHFNGIEKMIVSETYCVDILKQIAAVQSALSQMALKLVASHLKHCVSAAVRRGEGDTEITELVDILKYLKHF